jgi:hypothetical protein
MRKQTALTSKIAAKKAATRATPTIASTMVVPAERLLDMASIICYRNYSSYCTHGCPEKLPQLPPRAEAKAPDHNRFPTD